MSEEFTLDEKLSAAEAPDRVYRSARTGRVLKVRAREKTAKELPRNAPRFGRGYYRVTASHCGENGKTLPLADGHRIGSGVNVTIGAGDDFNAVLEAARVEAMLRADAEADGEDQRQSATGVRGG